MGPGGYIHDVLGVVELEVLVAGAAESDAVGVEAVADNGADVFFDIAETLDAYGAEDAEAGGLEILEDGAGLGPVVAVGAFAVGVEEDCGVAYQGGYFVLPALGVGLDFGQSQLLACQADVAPGVAAEGPAGAFELGYDGGYGFPFLLAGGFPLVVPAFGGLGGAVA